MAVAALAAMLVGALPNRIDVVSLPLDFSSANTPIPDVNGRYAHMHIAAPDAPQIDPGRALFWQVKIPIAAASAADIANAGRISLALGERIATMQRSQDRLDWQAIDALPGIGPKTLTLLQSAFDLAVE